MASKDTRNEVVEIKLYSHQATPSQMLQWRAKMGMQPFLPVTVPFKKIKGATCQRYGVGNGIARCEQTFRF